MCRFGGAGDVVSSVYQELRIKLSSSIIDLGLHYHFSFCGGKKVVLAVNFVLILLQH